jgi:predicted dehydrogenase
MEAFHYRYHGLVGRLLEIVGTPSRRGELGELRRIDTWFEARLADPRDIRWDLTLAGGALMDLGCYPLHLGRTLAGAEPQVASAAVVPWSGADAERYGVRVDPLVDERLEAELVWARGLTGSVTAHMLADERRAGARVEGALGTLHVDGFVAPHLGHLLRVETRSGVREEVVPAEPTTYDAQLRVFADAVLHGGPVPTDVTDAVRTMRVIDACYGAAGLPPREPTPW